MCEKLPTPALPPLPLPFSIGALTPPITIGGELFCCKLPSFSNAPSPVALTVGIKSSPTYAAAVVVVQNAVKVVKAYVDALPSHCPLE